MTNLNVILYLSTCHTVYISVLIIFTIMQQLIISTYVSLVYELKKTGKVFTSKIVGTGPSSYEKRIYRAAVSQRLRNTVPSRPLRSSFQTKPLYTFPCISHECLMTNVFHFSRFYHSNPNPLISLALSTEDKTYPL